MQVERPRRIAWQYGCCHQALCQSNPTGNRTVQWHLQFAQRAAILDRFCNMRLADRFSLRQVGNCARHL